MATTYLSLNGNADELVEMMKRLELLAPKFPERVKEAFIGFIDGSESAEKLIQVDVNEAHAGGTGEILITLKPSELFRELMAALAGDGHNDCVIQ